MKKFFLLISTGILFIILGCSGDSQKSASKSSLSVVHASAAPASASPAAEPAAALPVPSVVAGNQQTWRSEHVRDRLGNALALKGASLDGKFDLVILRRGSYSFLSFARHTHWEAVHDRPAKGKLMYLRVKFEDGEEKRIEWDELGFATENLCSVLWSYPVKTDAPIGPVPQGVAADSVGGDQVLIEDIMKHKAMLLEVEPGVTTQFDVSGLAPEMAKTLTPKAQPMLEARQASE